jgi:hypothetical protein
MASEAARKPVNQKSPKPNPPPKAKKRPGTSAAAKPLGFIPALFHANPFGGRRKGLDAGGARGRPSDVNPDPRKR